MNIQITGRHVEVTDAIKGYVDEKIGKVEHYFDHITSTKVILAVEKEQQVAEAIITVPGSEFVAKAEDKDLYAAIDMLEDKLARQLKKHKNKMRCNHSTGHSE
ncbi:MULTISPECIES: ribosome hibernation-promoting factor, HPF/YfiA family [unclassified Francisella]|uniref:ribosome hibernation-promoting factor, HPF/YfiA family n=1 Tax=unclassified Francisella TaxID=2610885 RepID=UPI002E303AFD|nr:MULTISPECIES: ribosome-associated translation inhibitor RaiA [unclassified Francisella]MED7820181.1 ribosome-associated translation inhibitor RaiA [Francisella sp. 19S2-4]MED7831001.1 ribosome-associated translation inhibitor RaiA [Francisella sp. 19S2-10]